MAGIKGLRFRKNNTKLHHDRLKRLEDRRLAKVEFDQEVARRRLVTIRVPFGHGWLPIRTPKLYTLAECELLHSKGLAVPLDLVPEEYWRVELPSGQVIYPHSEEWLGDKF